eukprot:CAMPEP_0119412656 /NCGR_PEP_ID=MMETSP1335-20130426/5018_1 /TAXON_ID=259385 /ORGANISM="Chrysoculter rhomboideus, Strain RCC1486" /LENGTH=61 /DNA_ID=CAMNT_0007437407 /DNA_START=309 /DNA_END=490 /DNA_ORIENTATION=-
MINRSWLFACTRGCRHQAARAVGTAAGVAAAAPNPRHPPAADQPGVAPGHTTNKMAACVAP